MCMLFKEHTSTLKKFLKEVTYAHQGCIYLIKNMVKTGILWNIITMENNHVLV